MSHENVTYEYK